jgi:hypothetical protein
MAGTGRAGPLPAAGGLVTGTFDNTNNDALNGDGEKKSESKEKEDQKPKKQAPAPKPESEGFDIIPVPPVEVAGSSPAVPVWRSLRKAALLLKFAVTEQGDPAAFFRAWHWLEDAALKLEDLRSDKAVAPELLKSTSAAIDRLRRELGEQEESLSKTMYGRFPLIRAFGISPIDDEDRAIRSYLTPGMAERRAVGDALSKIAKSASSDPLSIFIFVSGASPAYESGRLADLVEAEAPEAFNELPDIRLYLASLHPEMGPMPAWNTPDPAMDAVCRRFFKSVRPDKDPRSLMLVMVRKIADESHDRSQYNYWFAAGCGLLLVLSLAVHEGLSLRSPQAANWVNWLGIPVFGFLTGLILTPLLMLALKRGMPDLRSTVLVGG